MCIFVISPERYNLTAKKKRQSTYLNFKYCNKNTWYYVFVQVEVPTCWMVEEFKFGFNSYFFFLFFLSSELLDFVSNSFSVRIDLTTNSKPIFHTIIVSIIFNVIIAKAWFLIKAINRKLLTFWKIWLTRSLLLLD